MDSIINFFASEPSPIIQALYAGLFTWILTSIGAALVFLFKSIYAESKRVLESIHLP